jgi:hypothetical protein
MVIHMKSHTAFLTGIIAITVALVVTCAGCTTPTTPSPSPSAATTNATALGAAAVYSRPASLAAATNVTNATGMFTYRNSSVGVQFSYPVTWMHYMDPTQGGQYPDTYYTLIPNNHDDQSMVIFSNQSTGYYPGNTNDEILRNFIAYQTYANASYNYTVVQDVTNTTLGGQPAVTALYSLNFGGEPQMPGQMRLTATIKGNDIYCVFSRASSSYYAALDPAAQQVLNSFTFI